MQSHNWRMELTLLRASILQARRILPIKSRDPLLNKTFEELAEYIKAIFLSPAEQQLRLDPPSAADSETFLSRMNRRSGRPIGDRAFSVYGICQKLGDGLSVSNEELKELESFLVLFYDILKEHISSFS